MNRKICSYNYQPIYEVVKLESVKDSISFAFQNFSLVSIPINMFAYYVDYKLCCVLYYYKSDGDLHTFLQDNRLFLARSENISWERIQIKLVEDANGVALSLPVVAS